MTVLGTELWAGLCADPDALGMPPRKPPASAIVFNQGLRLLFQETQDDDS